MLRESRELEFKAEVSSGFLKTVSAFANFDGGKILFGVNDDGSVCGVENPQSACLDIENRINDSIKPKPDFRLEVNRKNGVVTLSVDEGADKPYFFRGKAYRRNDTATVETDGIELRRLALEGSNLCFDQLPCRKTDLKFAVLERELQDKLGIEKLTADILRTLALCSKDMVFNKAAELMSDENSCTGVDMARFGSSISEILDRETFAGVSLLTQFKSAVKLFGKYYRYEKIEGFERKTYELVPEEAFREALANALVHRTYDINAHVSVAMFPDRVEVCSPGGLPKGVTREKYLQGGLSSLRNPILGSLFFRLNYIEKFGTGVRRIMSAYKASASKPEFQITECSVTVILPLLESNGKAMTESEKRVCEALRGAVQLSSSELATATGFTKIKTIRLLNSLLKKGAVAQSGNGRSTRYRLCLPHCAPSGEERIVFRAAQPEG